MEALLKRYAELLQAVVKGDRSKAAELTEVKKQLEAAKAGAPAPKAEEPKVEPTVEAEPVKEEVMAEPEAPKGRKGRRK